MKPKMYKGKSLMAGGGGRFTRLEDVLSRRGGIEDAGALASVIGRKKWGKGKMSKWAAAGRRRD